MPGKQTDSPAVRRASRSTWGRLLRAGVEIYEYQPTFFHCKVMVVDGVWVSVGSTNFDTRSFSTNDEANLNVYDREFAAAQARIFEQDRNRCGSTPWGCSARSSRLTLAACGCVALPWGWPFSRF